MNLYRLGNKVLNLDRINGILDQHDPSDLSAPAGQNVLRVLFDHSHIDLADREAQVFRHWYRHRARSLDPHKDEEGEELVSPDEQVRRAVKYTIALIDRVRPRDTLMRNTAHRLHELVDLFLTGELGHVRVDEFEKSFAEARVEA